MTAFILLITLPVFSEDDLKYYQALQEVKIYEMMKDNAKFAECYQAEKTQIESEQTIDPKVLEEISTCVLGDLNKEQALELDKKLNLVESHHVQNTDTENIKNFLKERLQEGLFGELLQTKQGKGIRIGKHIDQSVFLEMYARQIQQSRILAISEYCYQKDDLDPSKLQNKSFTDIENLFRSCQQTIESTNCKSDLSNPSADQDPQVCALKKKIRQSLVVLDKIAEYKKALSEIGKDTELRFQISGSDFAYNDGKNSDEKSLNDLLTLSSKDIVEGLSKADKDYYQQLKKKFEKACANSKNPECEKIAMLGEVENLNKLALKNSLELDVKIKVVDEFQSKQDLLDYLKTTNEFAENELELLSKEDINTIRQKAKNIFTNQKNALVESINKKLQKRLSKNPNQSNIDNVRDEIEMRGDTIESMIQFHNAISALMEYRETDSDGKIVSQGFNTKAIELERNFTDPSTPQFIKDYTPRTSRNIASENNINWWEKSLGN